MKHDPGIKLILETDAIIHPLTGIGRYALELLQHFVESDDFSDIRCLSRGRWYQPQGVIDGVRLHEHVAADKTAAAAGARWQRNPAKAVLRRLLPRLNQRSLGKYAGTHIYHSPNYRLSPFEGKKIATFHDLSLFLYPQYHPEDRLKVLTPAIEEASQTADHLITDTLQVRKEIMAYFGVPGEKISAIPLASSLHGHGMDAAQRDRFLQTLGLKPDRYFLFVSTLEPRKNISGLLGAYELLPAAVRKHYPLVLAGQLGWKSDDILPHLERGKRRGDVIQPGFLSNEQICQLYAGARAFVYPSFYEGFGLPVIEAQEFGVPVITSDCSCLPEVAGEGALYISPQAYTALASAMQELVEDQQLHARLSRLARQNAGKYCWSNTANQTIELYRKVAKG